MKALWFIFAVCAALIIDSNLTFWGISTALSLIPVYYIGLRHGHNRGLAAGVLIGVFVDSLTGGMLGPAVLGKGLAGFCAFYITKGFFRWTPLLGVIGLFAITLLDGVVEYSSLFIFSGPSTGLADAVKILFVQAAINSIAGLFIKPTDED